MINNTAVKENAPVIYLGTFIGISVITFAAVGLFANFIVLFILSISRRTRYSHYKYLISHLAISDFCCSILLCLYGPIELHNHEWIYSNVTCKFLYPAITFCTNLSIGTILIISIERYRGVILPHLMLLGRRTIWVALIMVWLCSFILIIPNIIQIKVISYQNKNYCNEKWENKDLQKIYGISFFIVVFFLPLLAITIMHGRIMHRVHNRDISPSNISQWTQRNDVRITQVLTAMIIAFLICILPNKLLYFVWDIAPSLEKNNKVRRYLRTIQILYYSRVAIDPLLYCFLDTRFKKDVKNCLRKVKNLALIDSESRPRANTGASQQKDIGNRTRTNTVMTLVQTAVVNNENDQPPLCEVIKTKDNISDLNTLEREQLCSSPLSSSLSPLVSKI